MGFKVKIFMSMGNRFSKTLLSKSRRKEIQIWCLIPHFKQLSCPSTICFTFVWQAVLFLLCLVDQQVISSRYFQRFLKKIIKDFFRDLFKIFSDISGNKVWENLRYVCKILQAFHLLDIKHPSPHSPGCTTSAPKNCYRMHFLTFLSASRLDLGILPTILACNARGISSGVSMCVKNYFIFPTK